MIAEASDSPVELSERYRNNNCADQEALNSIIDDKLSFHERLRYVQSLDFSYVDHDSFHEPSHEDILAMPPPKNDERPNESLLTKEEEMYYFRLMNYAKFRAAPLKNAMNTGFGIPTSIHEPVFQKIYFFYSIALNIRNLVINANEGLVASIAQRYAGPSYSFCTLKSDAGNGLINTINSFDFGMGNKFSTFATLGIRFEIFNALRSEYNFRKKFRQFTVQDKHSFFEQEPAPEAQSDIFDGRRSLRIANIIGSSLGALNDHERAVISARFGIGNDGNEEPAADIAKRLGVTNKRIFQILSAAKSKIRAYLKYRHGIDSAADIAILE